jgi:hypothetical protein
MLEVDGFRLSMTLAVLLLVMLASGCDDYSGEPWPDADADAGTDTLDTTEEAVVDVPVDTPVETGPDTGPDTAPDTPVDIPPDSACPPNDASHLYISIAGQVRKPLGGYLDESHVSAVAALEFLTASDPGSIGSTVSDSSGAFSIPCINVKDVALGLVLVVDDRAEDGLAGLFLPTGTPVASWATDTDKVDIPDAVVYLVDNSFVTLLESVTSNDASDVGLVMGIVNDGSTGTPINGAEVRYGDLTVAPVVYPSSTGFETDGDTSSLGLFVFDISSPMSLTTITAVASGHTFGTYQAATRAGACYFLVLEST